MKVLVHNAAQTYRTPYQKMRRRVGVNNSGATCVDEGTQFEEQDRDPINQPDQ
jgi:hypothetical protein